MDPRVADLMRDQGLSEEEARVMVALDTKPTQWDASCERDGFFTAIWGDLEDSPITQYFGGALLLRFDGEGREAEYQFIGYFGPDEGRDPVGARLDPKRCAELLADPDCGLHDFLMEQPLTGQRKERLDEWDEPDGFIETRASVELHRFDDPVSGAPTYSWKTMPVVE